MVSRCDDCYGLDFLFVPEVKDRTLEEIDEIFAAGLSARKFKGYKCTATTFTAQKATFDQDIKEPEVVETETVLP